MSGLILLSEGRMLRVAAAAMEMGEGGPNYLHVNETVFSLEANTDVASTPAHGSDLVRDREFL
mgnify:FL=1